jgi:hypothetical protein
MVFIFQRKVEKRRIEWKENQKNDKDFFKIPLRIIWELNTHDIAKLATYAYACCQ